jgi:cystathionine beta-lyase/cystathionine gamma-synthase
MKRGPGTTAVHGRRGAPRGPLATPIAQTSTFAFGSAAEMRRYLEGDEELFLYTRYANPTVRELAETLAALEVRVAGIDPGMVRLSLGVEDADALIADVEQALAAE